MHQEIFLGLRVESSAPFVRSLFWSSLPLGGSFSWEDFVESENISIIVLHNKEEQRRRI
jgi:hypothetical protein